jgi:hypothetical protein
MVATVTVVSHTRRDQAEVGRSSTTPAIASHEQPISAFTRSLAKQEGVAIRV